LIPIFDISSLKLDKNMPDKYLPSVRSMIMSKIKSSNTKPEILVRKFLYQNRFRFRRNVKSLPGTPDIVISKISTVIFINGCFWHGHENCKFFKLPQTRTDFWQNKIKRNSERDKESIEKLQKMGWNVIVIWECQLKPKKQKVSLEKLLDVLYSLFLQSVKI